MITTLRRRTVAAAAAAALTFGLVACSDDSSSTDTAAEGGESTTVQVEDNFGTQTVPVPPKKVVATDNRVFRTLEDWGSRSQPPRSISCRGTWITRPMTRS